MTVDNAGYFCCAIMKQKEIKKYVDTIRGRFVIFCRYHSDSFKMWDQEDRFRRGNRSFMVMLLQDGLASVVVPIDKLSILVTIIFSRIVFGERLNKKSLIGLGLIVAGTILLSLIS